MSDNKLSGLESLKAEYDKKDKKRIGCGKEIIIRKFKNIYRRVCGGVIKYGSKKNIYCKECQAKLDALNVKRETE